jgi:FkbM family methyltransferase
MSPSPRSQWSCHPLSAFQPFSLSALVCVIVHIIHFWPGRNLIRRALRLIVRNRNFKVTLKKPGATIEGRYADHADFHAVCEVFLERAYDIASVRPNPTLIVDAGGHIGTFAVLAGLAFPTARLLSFEPDPDNFRLLTRNIARNHVRADLQNLALADFDGQTLLDGPSSMGRRIGAATGRLVPVRRLSKLIELHRVERLLLKLDVEGVEWSILEDCAAELPENAIIFIETHGGDADLKKLEEFSSRFGFSYEHTRDKGTCHESTLRRGMFAGAQAAQKS